MKFDPSKARNLVGPRIREARLNAKPPVSQDDLSSRLAVKGIFFNRTAISRMENQDRYVKDYEAAAIAKCLKVTIGWLYGEGFRGGDE